MTATTPTITFFERSAPLSLALIVAAAALLCAGALPAAAFACAERAAPLSTPLSLILAVTAVLGAGALPAAAWVYAATGALLAMWLLFLGCGAGRLGAAGGNAVRRGAHFRGRSGRFGGGALRALLVAALPAVGGAQNASYCVGVVTLAGRAASVGFADGSGAGVLFYFPSGVAIDASGHVFVADQVNQRIRKVTPGGAVTTLAGSGSQAFADGTGAGASFRDPYGVAVDTSGNVFVGDANNHRIRKVTPGGVVTTLAGSSAAAFADGTGTGANFWLPHGTAVDASGNVIVADYKNHRIRKVTSEGVVTTLAGNGVCRRSDDCPYTNAGAFADGAGTDAMFNFPTGVAIDASGNVFVADSGNTRIRKVTPGGVVTTLAGSGGFAFADGTGAGASFHSPRGVAIDDYGNVLVADYGNNRIRLVTPGGVVSTLAGNAGVGNDNACLGASLNFPTGVAIDASGNVLVTNSGDGGNTIRKIFRLSCPKGFYCPGGGMAEGFIPCTTGTYCPEGSFAPTPCPADAPGLLVSASSLAACYINSGSGTVAIPPGAACVSNASCASGSCLGGFCCSVTAKAAGCVSCQPGTGSCALFSPGEACASAADCGTNECLGGCCCSAAAARTMGCTACQCWANASTSAATAGACLAAPPPPPPLPACACAPPTPAPPLPNSTTPRCLACDAFDASQAVEGLFILAAANPLNPSPGEDLAVGLPGACASLAGAAAAQGVPPAEVEVMLPCLARPAFLRIDGANYTVLGPAAPLRLAALPENCGAAK
jgi:sugar lactone lactonase YvrE